MKKIILFICLVFSSGLTKAAAPTWSVNPNSYQYSMTITGIANIACADLANNNNRIGAFVNGVCRGTVLTNVIISNKNFAFLIVYSNVASGENVTFKIYNSLTDIVSNAVDSVNFVSANVIGDATTPFVFRSNHGPSDIGLNTNFITENTLKSAVIETLTTIDADATDTHTFALVAGTNDRDNAFFKISGNQLLLDAALDVNLQDTLKIRIRVADNKGCSYEEAFKFAVKNANNTPTELSISNASFFENQSSAKVGAFTNIDADTHDTSSTYTFTTGASDADNSNFTITGSHLFFNGTADYESKNQFFIRCRVTDAGSLFYEKSFTINVMDVNEKPQIHVMGYEVSESASLGSEIGTVMVTELDASQDQTFEILGTTPFAIDPATGSLTLKNVLDYEMQPEYTISISVHDNGTPSLADTLNIKIKVLDAIEEDVFLSSDFVSPNGDDKNDFWKIANVVLYKDYALYIMDEYQQTVYKIAGNYNNEWDATLDGAALPNGNYYYLFKNDNTGKSFKGIITVVK